MPKWENLKINGLLLGSLLALVFVAATTGAISRDMLFFADALYLPIIFRDIFELGGRLSDWYQTPAAYWFPDYLLYLPSALLAKTNYMRIVIMSVTQVLASFFVCSFLARAIKLKNPFMAGVWSASLLTLSGLGSQWPAVIVFLSAHHYGVILMTVTLLGLILPCFYEPSPSRRKLFASALGGFLLVTVGVASDRMLIVQGVLPILASLMVQCVLDRKLSKVNTLKLTAIFGVLILMATLLGRDVAWHFRRNHPGLEPAILWDKIPESLGLTIRTLKNIAWVDPVSAFLTITGMGLCFFAVFSTRNDDQHRMRRTAALTALFAVASPLAVFVLTGEPAVIARYYGSVFLMPLIVGGVLAFQRLSIRKNVSYGVVLLLLGLILVRIAPWKNSVTWEYVPEHIACVETELSKRGLNHGVADYWDSMVLMGMTDNRINVAHFTPGEELKPYRWIASERHITGRYDFAAVVENPKFRLILPESFGKPREVLRCGKLELRIFGKSGYLVPPD